MFPLKGLLKKNGRISDTGGGGDRGGEENRQREGERDVYIYRERDGGKKERVRQRQGEKEREICESLE